MLCCPIHHTAQIWPQSDLYLFDPLKNAICGLKFRDDDEVIKKLMMWMWQTPQDLNQQELHALPGGGKL